METFIRDNFTQFIITALLGFLAIVVSIIAILITLKKKRLTYEVISENSLVNKSTELEDVIQIKFHDAIVSNVYLVVYKFCNNGNVHIPASDFERNITFFFGNQSKLLSVELSEWSPLSLFVEYTIDEHSVVVKPLLLNKGDWFSFKVLVSGYEHMAVHSRVNEVKEIEQKVKEGRGEVIYPIILSVMGLIILILMFIKYPKNFIDPILFAIIMFSIIKSFPTFMEALKYSLKKKV